MIIFTGVKVCYLGLQCLTFCMFDVEQECFSKFEIMNALHIIYKKNRNVPVASREIPISNWIKSPAEIRRVEGLVSGLEFV